MEVKFKQSKNYGCGLYALANLFQSESIINKRRLTESKNGNNIFQMNKWLSKDLGYTLEPLYAHLDSNSFPLPPKGTNFATENDGDSVPLLIDTSNTQDGRKHVVAALADNKGNVVIIDSLKEETIVTKWEHLISGAIYNFIIAIYGVSENKTSGKWIIFQNCEVAFSSTLKIN